MSLFPAYGSNDETAKSETVSKPCDLAWLTNQSFIPFTLNNETEEEQQDTVDAAVDIPPHRDDSTQHHAAKESKKRKRKEKKKHKKKSSKRRHRDSSGSSSSTSESEQTGTIVQPPVRISETDYYTDVDPLRIYLTVEKLHRPACPRYRLSLTKPLGSPAGHARTVEDRYKRYYRVHRKARGNLDGGGTEKTQSEISEQEERMERSLRTEETPDKWIELIRFRQAHPLPNLDSYQNHKRELAMIERARHRLPGDKALLDLYLEAIVRVHPTDEVLELVRRAIAKDETNVQLWRALIRNKQCSMAQCIVPDVLRLYESSTRALFMARRNDETMLQLFKNCATFCRQAGLCEQMFGMVQLTLGMNVSGRFGGGGVGGGGSGSLFASPEHYHQLVDYEEVILRSGLPMNEIWLRIETLRTAFHYLPFGGGQQLLSDPQRIVLNEDVVGFIYPLINKSYSFELTLIVLRLMKYPFANARHFEAADCFQVEPFEMDYPEQLLPLLLDVSRNRSYDRELNRFIKSLQMSPSYLNTNLAHEQYLEMVQQFLTIAIDHFEGEQSALLLVLYLQLERTLVCWEKASATAGCFDEQKAKLIRGRVKSLLKHTHASNQNNLLVYAEYGLLEYELTGLEGGTAACRKIFDTSVQVHCANAEQSTLEEKDEQEHAFCSLVLTMVELLLLNGHTSEAVHALTKLILNPSEMTFRLASEQEPPPPSNTSKLSALQKLSDRVNSAVRNETNFGATAPTVEQYFRPAPLITSLKAYVFYLTLIRTEGFKEAVRQLETLLFLFNEPTNPRHRFLREQIYELYLQLCNSRVSGWKVNTERPGSGESTRQLLDIVDRTLQDFPSNLYAVRSVVFNESVPWFRLRRLLGKHLSPKAVLLMVIGARFRANADDAVTAGETDPYKQRILNLLADAVKSPTILALHQNALLWRLYLRELFDQPNARPGYSVLEHCRRALYAALEACPWNKALYLDGASVAPQELSALLDLMMEKQLRVHAIPEELAILRNE